MRPARTAVSAFDLPSPITPAPSAEEPLTSPNSGIGFARQVVQKRVRPSTAELGVLTVDAASAVDVFIDLTAFPFTVLTMNLVIRIYAVVGGLRTLVGRGRATNNKVGFGLTTVSQLRGRRWVAAARCGAERFEVTISGDINQTFTADAPEFLITAIGYPHNGSPVLPRPLHLIRQWTAAGVLLLHSGCELLAASGDNAEAAGTAARFLQIWDSVDITLPAAAPNVLLEEIPIQPQQPWSVDYSGSGPLETDNGLIIANSTTSGAFTANVAASGILSYEVR